VACITVGCVAPHSFGLQQPDIDGCKEIL
jgi:hypothetical protein